MMYSKNLVYANRGLFSTIHGRRTTSSIHSHLTVPSNGRSARALLLHITEAAHTALQTDSGGRRILHPNKPNLHISTLQCDHHIRL